MLTTAFYRLTAIPSSTLTDLSERWLELRALRAILDERQIDTILDVGANTGQFVRKMRRLGYEGRIISFEPDPRTYERLVRQEAEDARWQGMPMALGDAEGTLPFHLATYPVLSSFLTLTNREQDAVHETIAVPVQRLDALWPTLGLDGARVLLKTDTQGFDLRVFRGAAGVWDRLDALFVELSVSPIYHAMTPFTSALDEYRQAGFALRHLALVNRTASGDVLEYDGLFVRSTSG